MWSMKCAIEIKPPRLPNVLCKTLPTQIGIAGFLLHFCRLWSPIRVLSLWLAMWEAVCSARPRRPVSTGRPRVHTWLLLPTGEQFYLYTVHTRGDCLFVLPTGSSRLKSLISVVSSILYLCWLDPCIYFYILTGLSVSSIDKVVFGFLSHAASKSSQ